MCLWKKALCGLTAAALLAGCTPAAETPAPKEEQPTKAPAPVVQTPVPAVKYEGLRLTREEMPILDGSTSTVPLAQAVCAVLLGEDRNAVSDLVVFSRTTQSYRRLMENQAELLIAAEPAATVVQEKEAAGFEWEMAPIATDALVFLVNEDNPVDNLTIEQVQKIYTGEITNWKEVGGEDRSILPFQRNEEAGSQTLMQKLVMGDLEMMEPEKEYIVESMIGLIEAVRSFDGSPGAIGYTVYYYANDMNMAAGLKVVSIEGAAPDAATIRSGEYPFTNPYYTTIAADAPKDSPVRKVFEWLQSPVGQSLIQHEGYVSVLDDPAPIEWDLGETEPIREVYDRLSDGPMPELIASDSYGELLSYVGDQVENPYWGGTFDKFGLVTKEGMIVTDPIYDGVYQMAHYNGEETVYLDLMTLDRTMGTGEESEQRIALAAIDGSWVTGFDWLYAEAVAEDRIWAVALNGDGVMLDLQLNELWRLELPEGVGDWFYQGGMSGSLWWNTGVATIFGGESGTQYVDLEGNVILESQVEFSDIQGYSEGLSAAHPKDNWDSWGYVNEAGEWVIDPVYSSAGDFKDGKAIVERNNTRYVINTSGEILLETADQLVRRTSSQGTWYLEYGTVRNLSSLQYWVGGAYDENLQPLEWDQQHQHLQWGSDSYLWYTDHKTVYLVNPYETVTIELENVTGYYSNNEDKHLIFTQGYGTEANSYRWSVWTPEGKCLLATEEGEFLDEITDSVTGKTYFYLQKGQAGKLYDAQGNYLTDCGSYPRIVDGLISVETQMSYGYKKTNGDWVFRISLMKSQGD